MNILVISSYLPFPLFSGGHIRLYNLISQLSQNHTITLVCEKRDYQTEEDITEVKKICKEVYTVRRRKQWSFENIIKSVFSWTPFLLVGHTNSEMKDTISKIVKNEKIDFIHVETFYVFQNLPKTSVPIILAEQNIEYLVYKRFAMRAPFVLKPFYYLDVLKLYFWEKYYWNKAARLIAVSQEEKQMMKKENVTVIPNGVDPSKFQISNFSPRYAGEAGKFQISNKENRVLFIGDFKWVKNRDAASWILKEVWPKIKSKIKNQKSKIELRLWIVGKSIPQTIKSLTEDVQVLFDENAPEETEKIFQQAYILLAPIRTGGGTSYKMLEAMSSGVPIVTTSIGASGFDLNNQKEMRIADTAEEIASCVVKLLQNQRLYEETAKNARKLVEEKYNWGIISKKLEEVYNSVTLEYN